MKIVPHHIQFAKLYRSKCKEIAKRYAAYHRLVANHNAFVRLSTIALKRESVTPLQRQNVLEDRKEDAKKLKELKRMIQESQRDLSNMCDDFAYSPSRIEKYSL